MESDRGQSITFGSIAAAAGLILGFLVGVVVAWVIWRRSKEQRQVAEVQRADVERLPLEVGHPSAAAARAPEIEAGTDDLTIIEGGPDDFTVIEGIGPRFSSVLKEAGISTFEQLRTCEPGEITAILREEDPRLARLADPRTWPEQAILAAAGSWDALEELQKELAAGRRVAA